jgi:hypothetical protein
MKLRSDHSILTRSHFHRKRLPSRVHPLLTKFAVTNLVDECIGLLGGGLV